MEPIVRLNKEDNMVAINDECTYIRTHDKVVKPDWSKFEIMTMTEVQAYCFKLGEADALGITVDKLEERKERRMSN